MNQTGKLVFWFEDNRSGIRNIILSIGIFPTETGFHLEVISFSNCKNFYQLGWH